jgi:hypothetical protein
MSQLDYDSVLQVKAGLRINRLIEDYAYRNGKAEPVFPTIDLRF